MSNRTDVHPFDLLVERFAEVLARHLNLPSPATREPTRAPLQLGKKRSAAEIEKVTGRLLGRIKSHRGERIEEIAQVLGLSTRELRLSAKKLLAEGKIRTKGSKRSTRYYPA